MPLSMNILQDMFKDHRDPGRTAEQFYAEQFRVLQRDWVSGIHHNIHRLEALPLRHIHPLGSGSQGSIDEVELSPTKERYARKKWFAGANLEKMKKRFFEEVEIIKKLAGHPHVLGLLASYTRDREFGLLLPLADCDLWQILTMDPPDRKELISDQDLLRSRSCLISGLWFMHKHGIKHKDIKPQNILLRQGFLKFTDFGLSRDISELSRSATDNADRGTFRYMAPEVTDYQERGRAADVFSLACVLLEIQSILFGFSVDDTHSFSALGPFHQNLPRICSWIDYTSHLPFPNLIVLDSDFKDAFTRIEAPNID
ncbi:Mitogen-activated protein kinase kinase kinase 2 [Diplodia intermedia]|uniref:Mitogen-activated protein kinase kinase kinase 2 n=1 Tax=Diplodia intermedia TaxID=856260 RepID=A0ABR3U4W0_9PEZI